jgi:hypothetical protein
MARVGVDVTAGDELNRVGVPCGLASLHRELTSASLVTTT